MIIKDGDYTKCPHWVRWDEKSEDRVCEFDGECENFIVEQTNEEWLKSCNTEQLAEVLNTIINRCYECGGDTRVYCCPLGDCECNVVEWLKQPHRKE